MLEIVRRYPDILLFLLFPIMTTKKGVSWYFLDCFRFKTEREHHSKSEQSDSAVVLFIHLEPFGNFVILSDLVILNKQDSSNSSQNARNYFSLKAIWETDVIDVLEDWKLLPQIGRGRSNTSRNTHYRLCDFN